MMTHHLYLLLFPLFLSLATPYFASEWRNRTVYQLLTDRFSRPDDSSLNCDDLHVYCGGTFKGIQKQLDYIVDMGFDAVWISPVPQNLGGNDYHGYGAIDWYKINDRFGGEQDLVDLIQACHDRNVWVMADVVANHVGSVDLNFTGVNPFNETAHYHPKCQITEWENLTDIEVCRLANLPDLDQDHPWVRQELLKWISWLVNKYHFDGVRIDTARHVKIPFWTEFNKAAGVYTIGEVFHVNSSFVALYQKDSLDALLNYPLYFAIKDVFNSGNSMTQLKTRWDEIRGNFTDIDVLGNFIDNHDVPRFLSLTPSVTLLKSALAFVMFSQGIPIIYYGSEQSYAGGYDPNNREPLWVSRLNKNANMYQYVTLLNKLRKDLKVWDYPHVEVLVDDSFYAFTRGTTLIALTNVDRGD